MIFKSKSNLHMCLVSLLVIIGVAACGGGDGEGNTPAPPAAQAPPASPPAPPDDPTPPDNGEDIADSPNASGWAPGLFLDADTFIHQCAAPRSGIDPATDLSFPDLQGTVVDANNFLRSYSNDTYLWYDEIADRDPGLFETPEYFELLKTEATTPSGQPKDKFHFTVPTDEWFQSAQSGVKSGYGLRWVLISAERPRKTVVAYIEPDSPAEAANLARGAEVLVVDGVDLINSPQVDILNAAMFPEQAGEVHTFTVRDLDGTIRDITMISEHVAFSPVPKTINYYTDIDAVGYIVFNEHNAPAEYDLFESVAWLQLKGIDDLIVDLRYNRGGYLDIASEFAYMIAGSQTAGRIFETTHFNDKHPSTNPVTGKPLTPVPFHSTSQGFSMAFGEPLPTLDLARVFILSGSDTCSASEAIINGLRGIDVEVILIGSTTCGKPYGFYPTHNCGTTYHTIQLKGENEKGFGDYSDGFSPANSIDTVGTVVPGCAVADDFSHELGDQDEGLLAAAFEYLDYGTCPAPSSLGSRVPKPYGVNHALLQ